MSERRTTLLASLALLSMTACWGSTFYLIKDLLDRVPVLDFLVVRFAIASVALLLLAPRALSKVSAENRRSAVVLGGLYGVAQILQTAGLAHTAASVSGFVTGLYVVATPLLTALILKRRIPRLTWLAAGLATVGLGVLALHGFAIGYGELLTLIAAVIYAGHIVALGRFSTSETTLSLSLVQLIMITLVSAVAAFWPTGGSAPGIQLPSSVHDWLVVLYLALIASALTMVLQTWAQAHIEPSRAAVIMAMEPVWAAAFAVALGGERITLRMIIGGLAIVSAMYLVERPQKHRLSAKEYVR